MFDEIMGMGYKENVKLAQVRNVLEMESREEQIQEIIARVRAVFLLDLYLLTEHILLDRIKRQK